jgi:hypothetical protein
MVGIKVYPRSTLYVRFTCVWGVWIQNDNQIANFILWFILLLPASQHLGNTLKRLFLDVEVKRWVCILNLQGISALCLCLIFTLPFLNLIDHYLSILYLSICLLSIDHL